MHYAYRFACRSDQPLLTVPFNLEKNIKLRRRVLCFEVGADLAVNKETWRNIRVRA